MAAYIVFLREGPVHNPDEMQVYLRKTTENPPDPRLTPLAVYGAQTPLEGDPPEGVVILEFKSVQEAKDWYYGPEYQDRAPHRLAAADYRAVIVEGFDPAAFKLG
jgi:uncharacterized protein (DUF1330 family)